MYWRITSTLPSTADPLGFFFGSVLLAAEIYCVGVLIISLTMNVDPLKRPRLEREDDEALHAVEFVREDGIVWVHDCDETGRMRTLAWPVAMVPQERLMAWPAGHPVVVAAVVRNVTIRVVVTALQAG